MWVSFREYALTFLLSLLLRTCLESCLCYFIATLSSSRLSAMPASSYLPRHAFIVARHSSRLHRHALLIPFSLRLPGYPFLAASPSLRVPRRAFIVVPSSRLHRDTFLVTPTSPSSCVPRNHRTASCNARFSHRSNLPSRARWTWQISTQSLRARRRSTVWWKTRILVRLFR